MISGDAARIELARRLKEPARAFVPHAGQAAFARDQSSPVRFLRGGNRSGKTETGAWELASHLLDCHPHHKWGRPVHAAAVAPGWDQIGRYLWPKIQRYLPRRYIRDMSHQRVKEPEIPTDVILHNGSHLMFLSADAKLDKFASIDLDVAWVDEEIDGERRVELEARCIDRAGRVWYTFTPIQSLEWMQEAERSGEVAVYRLSMRENPHIDAERARQFLAKRNARNRGVRGEGDYAGAEGLVYPDLATHGAPHYLDVRAGQLVQRGTERALCPWPIPDTWPRVAGIDFGYSNPAVWMPGALDPDGRIIVYRCWYECQQLTSQWAREVAAPDLPGFNWAGRWADHDLEERMELDAAGVATWPATKAIKAGIERVSDRLMVQEDGWPRLLFVMETGDVDEWGEPIEACRPIRDEAGKYKYPPRDKATTAAAKKNLPVDEHNHAFDAVRYIVVGVDGETGGVEAELDALSNLAAAAGGGRARVINR